MPLLIIMINLLIACPAQDYIVGKGCSTFTRLSLFSHPDDLPPPSRFDHIFGMYVTRAGCVRRLDLIMVPRRSGGKEGVVEAEEKGGGEMCGCWCVWADEGT